MSGAPDPSEHPELDTLPEVAPAPPEAAPAEALDGRLGGSLPPGLREMKRAVTLLSLGSLVSITAPFFMCMASAFSLNDELMRWVWLSWLVLLPLTALAGGFALAKAIQMKRNYGVFPEVAWLAVFTLLGVPGGIVFLTMAIMNVW